MRISDWSSDVVLFRSPARRRFAARVGRGRIDLDDAFRTARSRRKQRDRARPRRDRPARHLCQRDAHREGRDRQRRWPLWHSGRRSRRAGARARRLRTERMMFEYILRLLILLPLVGGMARSEEHTSELQSLMRISYAVFCLKKKKHRNGLSEVSHNTQNILVA